MRALFFNQHGNAKVLRHDEVNDPEFDSDDVVVRVQPAADGGTQVDVRSISRVGQSDLGANAARIGEILNGLGG